MKKIYKRLIPMFLIILLAGSFLLYAGKYYHADETALQALGSGETVTVSGAGETVTVSATGYGWYFNGPSEENLLCFYPGAKIEETAYAPLLRMLAARGMDVCLVKMPFRFAFFGTNKAEKVLAGYDHPNKYIGGHSLGGAMAAVYAADHAGTLSGVILLAAYPTKPLGDVPALISIYGSEDGILNTDRVLSGRAYAPDRYTETVIAGGNHAQFGNYGEQRGDGATAVSREEQQEQTVTVILQNVNT